MWSFIVIIQFNTSVLAVVYVDVTNWLHEQLGPMVSLMQADKPGGLAHPAHTGHAIFANLKAMYLEKVPTDSNLEITEICHEVGDTWETYRIKYAERIKFLVTKPERGVEDFAILTLEQLIVVLSDADAVMMKLALRACDHAHMSVVSEQ